MTPNDIIGLVLSYVYAFGLLVLPGSSLSPTSEPVQMGAALLAAFLAAVVATLAEAASPAGTDNLSVPLLTTAALYLLLAL